MVNFEFRSSKFSHKLFRGPFRVIFRENINRRTLTVFEELAYIQYVHVF